MNVPKKILLIRTDRLGDVILSTPVISNLRIAYPDSHIAFMCRPYTKDVLLGNPDLDEVIVYDKYNKQRSLVSSIKFALSLRKKKFDWAIILHPTNRMHMVTFFAGIPMRLGWDRKVSFLLSKKIPHKKHEGTKHELEYNLDMLRFLGIEAKNKETFFPSDDTSRARVNNLLSSKGIKNEDKIITIHPSASCPSKRWPQDKFLQLIDLLKEKSDFKIIIITSKLESPVAQKIINSSDVIDLRGTLNILEVGALFKRSKIFISNDSGPVHIAASLNIPVISIFGRSDPGLSPKRWAPIGKSSFYFHKDAGCPVCLAHNCDKNFVCLEKINPCEVAKKAIEMMEESKD